MLSTDEYTDSLDQGLTLDEINDKILDDAATDVPMAAKDLGLVDFETALDSFINEDQFNQAIQSLLEPDKAEKQCELIRQYFLDVTMEGKVRELDGVFDVELGVVE